MKRSKQNVYVTHQMTPEQHARFLERQRLVSLHRKFLTETGQARCTVCGWTPPAAISLVTSGQVPPFMLECHHLIPVAAGGTDDPDNLMVLCPNHHRMADILCRMSIYGKRDGPAVYGITDRQEMVDSILLLESDPEAWMQSIREERWAQQASVTDMLSAILAA